MSGTKGRDVDRFRDFGSFAIFAVFAILANVGLLVVKGLDTSGSFQSRSLLLRSTPREVGNDDCAC